jgi:hypothetical protein
MRQRTLLSLLVVITALTSGSCTDPGSGPIVDAVGGVRGLAYIDRNGNGVLDPTLDGPLQGIAVKVVRFGTTTGEVSATTNNLGTFVIQNLPVGDYAVSVDNATVPDSLRVIKIDSARVRVAANDTPTVVVTFSFPTMTARAIRQQLAGKRVFIEGTTLNSWATYGDSTLHIADTSGVLRVTRVAPANVTSGVRVRVLGTTDARDGQNTLTDASVFVIASAPVPAPTVTTTNIAARADAGKLDAALVQVNGAAILGAQTTLSGDFLLTVNDGSGTLEVLIDRNTVLPRHHTSRRDPLGNGGACARRSGWCVAAETQSGFRFECELPFRHYRGSAEARGREGHLDRSHGSQFLGYVRGRNGSPERLDRVAARGSGP